MKQHSALKKYLVLPILIFYSLILFFSACPAKLFPYSLLPLHKVSNQILAYLGTRGGKIVFNTWTGEYKQRFICLTVEGERTDGSKTILYQSHENCKAPKLRIIEDVVDRSLVRIFVGAAGKGREFSSATKLLNKSKRIRRIAKYFCYSKQVPNDSVEKVYIKWLLRSQNYHTGEIREQTGIAHQYKCQKSKRVAR